MANPIQVIRRSDHPAARLIRGVHRGLRQFSFPIPSALARPIAAAVLAGHRAGQRALQAFLCEPYLRARCFAHGEGIRTGCFFHFIAGYGRITLGDRVRMDGKSSIMFASILDDVPELRIGDDSYVNHNATIVVARRVEIGRKVLIGPNVTIFDSPGHPLDPIRRAAGEAPRPEEIKAVTIEDHAWICTGATIFPGVTIGEGSVVALGSIVTQSVPPRVLVAGAPARVVRNL